MDKLDILSREEFVERLVKLTENISANKSTTSFAINGAWGCGKSFVLDIFEEELSKYQSEETAMDKYFIIRYNCWKYDYYEEPLIAIVSTILDVIEEKAKLIPDTQENREIHGMLIATGIALLTILKTTIKSKTGVDAKAIYDAYKIVSDGAEEAANEFEKEHSFDVYFSFKKVMDKLHEELNKLSKEFTIVLLVDELDRCLPEYAIKVLERLHHLSEDSTNIITVISMDKAQLESSVKQIFGFENPEKYLEKFINFEVTLDYGTVSEKITEKYADYISLFDVDLFTFPESVEEFMRELFTDVDIRSQEQIFKRAMLAHNLLFSEKKDYAFMCMELLIGVMMCIYQYEADWYNTPLQNITTEWMFSTRKSNAKPAFVNLFEQHISLKQFEKYIIQPVSRTVYNLPKYPSLYAAIIYLWYWIHEKNQGSEFRISGDYVAIEHNPDDLKKYVETIYMIK